MIRDALADLLTAAIRRLQANGAIPHAVFPVPEVQDTKGSEFGDFATNFAMVASKAAGMNPRQLAQTLADELAAEADVFARVEVAGPGFVNLFLQPAWSASFLATVVADGVHGLVGGAAHGRDPQRINVEFVSVNPNGPITVGSGRGAAFGSTLCRVLAAAGDTVHREYYINDGVNSEQMRQFAASVRALVRGEAVPERGYKGDYVQDVADRVRATHGEAAGDHDVAWFQQTSQAIMLEKQREDLAAFGVEFDTWFSEQALHDGGQVEACLETLRAHGVADERPVRTVLKLGKGGKIEAVEFQAQDAAPAGDAGEDEESAGEGEGATLWLRSTKFGDDMDRVLRRRDGRLTYIASDVAYHADKFNRPADAERLITILGPDHHGYIGRLTAVVAALRADLAAAPGDAESRPEGPEADLFASIAEQDLCRHALARARRELEVVIFQIVRFVKEGQPAPMRKRDGNIYALIDLVQELGRNIAPDADAAEQARIGRDVARFFYLMRSHDTHLDFDIDLATKQSDDNPVFYVQYAHARIGGVLRRAEEAGLAADLSQAHRLVHPREQALIRRISDLPYEVRRCAADYGVHRLATYAVELARSYHHFYDACRVVQPEDPALSGARLGLCAAARIALQGVLGLLGVSAPERMESRPAEAAPDA